jgi:uncharacterized membrane protein YraQ (UPF0718 family)
MYVLRIPYRTMVHTCRYLLSLLQFSRRRTHTAHTHTASSPYPTSNTIVIGFLASSATQRWRKTSILLTASLPMEARSVALPRLRGYCLLFSNSVHQHLRHLRRHLWYLLGWTGGYCFFFLLLSGLLLHWR